MLENAKIQKLSNSNETFLVFTKQCTVIENQQNIFEKKTFLLDCQTMCSILMR